MCRTSSRDEAKTVMMEIQINSAGTEFELEDNGQLRSNRLDFIQYYVDKLKSLWQNKRTFAFKTIPNVCGITRALVWALGINARGILMAFVYFNVMTLLAFVNFWKRTSLLYPTTKIEKIIVSASIKKTKYHKMQYSNYFLYEEQNFILQKSDMN